MRELDWTPSKTSRVLSSMEDNEQVIRHRIGRRNLVCLPNQDYIWVEEYPHIASNVR